MSKDTIYRQDAIDEIEYELEMINSALDSTTLDFNARERLRQRRGEAREILNSIQQLPSADRPSGEWVEDTYGWVYCSHCKKYLDDYQMVFFLKPFDYCPNCGARMLKGGNYAAD